MTKKIWLDDYDKRCDHREYLTIIVNASDTGYDALEFARDALCVLDEYEMVLAELDNEKKKLNKVVNALLGFVKHFGAIRRGVGLAPRDKLRTFELTLLDAALAALDANIGKEALAEERR